MNPKNFRAQHLISRETSEKDFFGVFCDGVVDKSNPIFIEKGEINDVKHVQNIINMNPEIIISYGCSIIKSELLNFFKQRFINIHLGLSPYYRGSGTNFWPFFNSELQFIGTTFMYIDEGIDTGEIIHQIRASIDLNDNIHQIGNRLIKNSIIECCKLIDCFKKIQPQKQIKIYKKNERYYKQKDFTEDSLLKVYDNLKKGVIEYYIKRKNKIDNKYPIINNLRIF
jgi:methionyl-tRNA formyltransferase